MLPAIQIDPSIPPIVEGPQLDQALQVARYRLPEAAVALWHTAEWQVLEQAYDLVDTYVSYIELRGLDSIKQQIPIHCPRHDLYWLYVLQGRVAIMPVSVQHTVHQTQGSTRAGHYRISYLPAGPYQVQISPGQHQLFYMVHKPRMLFREPSDELFTDVAPIHAARNRGDVPSTSPILSMQDGAQHSIHRYLLAAGRTYLQRKLRIHQLSYDLITVAQQSIHQQKRQLQTVHSWAAQIQEHTQHCIQNGIPVDMQALAQHLRISVSYLRTVFRTATGQTIGRYITECKLQHSRELLRSGLPPTQTAYYLDWHPAHFSTAFRIRYGESPTQYIQRIEKDS